MDELSSAVGALASTTSCDATEPSRTFTCSPKLPSEIRVQIWESSFVPRRILLQYLTSRPAQSLRSSATLLLVSREASHVYKQHYYTIMKSQKCKALQINYSIDTLFLFVGLLKTMLLQHPQIMARIQYLDIAPSEPCEWQDWRRLDTESMPSIRLLTIRWGCGLEKSYAWGGSWPDDGVTTRIIAKLTNVFTHRKEDALQIRRPVVAMLLSPDEASKKSYGLLQFLKPEILKCSPGAAILKRASPATWDRFEIDIPEAWRSIWVGRLAWHARGWFAYEVEWQHD